MLVKMFRTVNIFYSNVALILVMLYKTTDGFSISLLLQSGFTIQRCLSIDRNLCLSTSHKKIHAWFKSIKRVSALCRFFLLFCVQPFNLPLCHYVDKKTERNEIITKKKQANCSLAK